MLLHHLPLLGRERTRLAQDVVGDGHLADVVQQRSTADVRDIHLADAHEARQVHGHVCGADGVPFGFVVAQVERFDPALEGHLVSPVQGFIGIL